MHTIGIQSSEGPVSRRMYREIIMERVYQAGESAAAYWRERGPTYRHIRSAIAQIETEVPTA